MPRKHRRRRKKRLVDRQATEWKHLLNEIKHEALRGKVAVIVWWDLYSESDRHIPAILKKEVRRYNEKTMGESFTKGQLYQALIFIGYSERLSRRRSGYRL